MSYLKDLKENGFFNIDDIDKELIRFCYTDDIIQGFYEAASMRNSVIDISVMIASQTGALSNVASTTV